MRHWQRGYDESQTVKIDVKDIKRETTKAILVQVPDNAPHYAGFSFWFPKSLMWLVRNDPDKRVLCLPAQMFVTLQKSGYPKYEQSALRLPIIFGEELDWTKQ